MAEMDDRKARPKRKAMSREDVCRLCDGQRWEHSYGQRHEGHGFQEREVVEPTRAEAPQGETVATACGPVHRDNIAAQPETGDGSIADGYSWANRTPTECLELGRIIERRARATENEAVVRLLAKHCDCAINHGRAIKCPACRVRDDLAARRGSGR